MRIEERIDEASQTFEREHSGDEDLNRLRRFYAEMKQESLVLKQMYDLPLLDTIGITAHRSRRD